MTWRLGLVLVGTTMLAGCSTFHAVRHANDKALGQIKTAQRDDTASFVSSTSAPYLIGAEIAAKKPESPLMKKRVLDKSHIPQSIQHIAGVITAQTGVPVRVTGMREGGGSAESGATVHTADTRDGSLPPPPASFIRTVADRQSQAPEMPKVRVWYDGPLKGFLQEVDAKAGISSRLADGEITLFRTETRTFTIPSLPQQTDTKTDIEASAGSTTSNSVGSSGAMGGAAGSVTSGSSGGQSGGDTSIDTTVKTAVWKSLASTAKTVANGARVSVNKALGTITVTGTPDQIAAVHQWVRGLDKSLGRMVSVTVKIFDVQLTHEQNYGFNPTLAFKNSAKAFGLSLAGAPVPQVLGQESPMSFAASILKTAQGDAGRFRGTRAAVQALATLGRVSQVYERSFTAMNDHDVPMQVGTVEQYPAESFSNLAANVGSSTGVLPGQVSSGFTADFFPRIVGNKVLLAMSMKLQSLLKMETIKSNGTTLKYPTTSHTQIYQTAALRSGSTLLVTGYGENDASDSHSGTGSPYLPILGGGADAQLKHSMIAIVVTARIL